MSIQLVRNGALACAALAALSTLASAQQVNGLKANPRVFNDIPTSTLTITNSNSIPGNVTIDDRGFPTGATGANRSDVLLSTDGGATARTFNASVGFTISSNINLTTTNQAGRREAGIRINDGVTGDTLFLVNSDAGEIVAFGGGAAFYSFGSNGGGNGYTPGTTINIGMTYRPGVPTNSAATPATIEYFVDRDINSPAGFSTSGQLPYSNNELGPLAFQVGVYEQGGGVAPSNINTATFTNLQASAVPEPTTLAALGLGAALLRRRRAAR